MIVRFITVLMLLFVAAGSLHAQTVTPTPDATAEAYTQITLFVDADSLTVYVPEQPTATLNDLAFEIVINGTRTAYRLDAFTAFAGLPFDDLPTPICFRFERAGVNTPLPLECPSTRTITQDVANANVFWYDSASAGTRTILIVGGTTDEFCPANADRCDVVYLAPITTIMPTVQLALGATSSPTQTATDLPPQTPTAITNVPSYPCNAQITFGNGGLLNQVHTQPRSSSPYRSPIERGSRIVVLQATQDFGATWYRIQYNNEFGWIEEEYIILSALCPVN